MTFDSTPFLAAFAALVAAVLTAVVIPYIKTKTTTDQQRQINTWVQIAVSAAEQIYNGPGRGEDKKKYVVEWLRQHGVTVDADKLDAMIEAAVYDLKNGAIIYAN